MASAAADKPDRDDGTRTEALRASVRKDLVEFLGPEECAAETPGTRQDTVADRLVGEFVAAHKSRARYPREIDTYRLVRFLGAGGMGAVFLAVSQRTGEREAVKIANPDKPGAAEALEREVRCLESVRHPNVLELTGSGRAGPWHWMAMPFVEGRTLSGGRAASDTDFHLSTTSTDVREPQAWAMSRPAPHGDSLAREGAAADPRTLVEWFRDLADALAAIHDAGFLHRDIKPSNILIDRLGRPYLIDFGLALHDDGSFQGLQGTIPFMSPEQLLGGNVDLTPASDTFSLAASFHEALSGAYHAWVTGQGSAIGAIAFKEPPPPSFFDRSLPRSLDPIFRKALAKDPAARYATGRRLEEDLDRWLANRPFRHAREPLLSRVRRVPPERRVALGLLALVVLSLGVLGFDAWRHAAERGALLDDVRELKAAGRYPEGLELLRRGADVFGEDEAFARQYEVLAAATGERATDEMLRELAFAHPLRTEGTAHQRIAERAERHWRFCRHPAFLFQRAFSAYLQRRFDRGLELLEEAPALVRNDPMLLDLRCLLEIRTEAFGAAQRTTEVAARAPEPRDVASRCLRALRIFRVAYAAGLEEAAAEGLTGAPGALGQGEEILDSVLLTDPGNLMARSLKGVYLARREAYEEALECFRELHDRANDADEINAVIWCTRAAIMAAGEKGTEEAWRVVDQFARRAADRDPRILEDVHSWVRVRTYETESPQPALTWTLRVLDPEWGPGPSTNSELPRLAAEIVKHLPSTAWERAFELSRALALHPLEGEEATGFTSFVHRVAYWSALRALAEALEQGEPLEGPLAGVERMRALRPFIAPEHLEVLDAVVAAARWIAADLSLPEAGPRASVLERLRRAADAPAHADLVRSVITRLEASGLHR